MNTLIIAITIAILSATMGALISFFVTTISQRKVTVSIIKELIDTHEKIYHKKTMEHLIEKHENKCSAIKEIEILKTGVNYLVNRAKGNNGSELNHAI